MLNKYTLKTLSDLDRKQENNIVSIKPLFNLT